MIKYKKIIATFMICFMFITFDSFINVNASQSSSRIKTYQAKEKKGLKGEYYSNKNLTNLKYTRTDSRINFDWGSGFSKLEMIIDDWNDQIFEWDEDTDDWSHFYDLYKNAEEIKVQAKNQILNTESFSVRWTGQIEPRYSEAYTFHTITDDGVRLWINNQLIIDQWYDLAATEYDGVIYLEANKKYNIKMEYYQNKNDACAKLLWSSKTQAKEIIPQERLYPNISTVAEPVNTGNGLKGEYYDNMNFSDLGITRIDTAINMDWGKGSPDANIGPNTFSVRWSGKIKPEYTETYTFYITADDGARLWVNNTLIVDSWNTSGIYERSGSITLAAGTKYDIRLEYYENQDSASIKLKWSSQTQTKEIIPGDVLYY